MTRLSTKLRRRHDRVEFCDRCSRVITPADCSRRLIEKARVDAIHAGMGRA